MSLETILTRHLRPNYHDISWEVVSWTENAPADLLGKRSLYHILLILYRFEIGRAEIGLSARQVTFLYSAMAFGKYILSASSGRKGRLVTTSRFGNVSGSGSETRKIFSHSSTLVNANDPPALTAVYFFNILHG